MNHIELLFVSVEFKDEDCKEVKKVSVGRQSDGNGVIVIDNNYYGDIAKDLYHKLFPNGITNN